MVCIEKSSIILMYLELNKNPPFCYYAGSTAAVGKRLLELCNGDLQRAISMHLDGVIDVDAIEHEGQASASTSTSLDSAGPSIPPE